MTFYKDGGQGAVVMVNSNEGASLIDEILRAVAREYAWPGYFNEDSTAAVSAGALDAYVGRYAAKAFECRVYRDGDRLMLELKDQPAVALRPTGANSFLAADVNAEVVFDKDDDAVEGLTLTQAGRGTTAERK
jgi:hypothetical protein